MNTSVQDPVKQLRTALPSPRPAGGTGPRQQHLEGYNAHIFFYYLGSLIRLTPLHTRCFLSLNPARVTGKHKLTRHLPVQHLNDDFHQPSERDPEAAGSVF